MLSEEVADASRNLKEEILMFLGFAQRTKGSLLTKGYLVQTDEEEGKKKSLIHAILQLGN